MDRITSKGFPEETASKEEKQTKEYGLQYVNALWAAHRNNTELYNTQRNQHVINRQYAEGLESVEKYKNRLELNDTSYVNLDFTPINRIATIIDNIEGKLTNQTFKPKCTPTDSESLTRYDKARNKLRANMMLAKVAPQIQEATGMPVIPPGEKIPESTDDIEMHMQLNFKMEEATAMEELIDFINDNNDNDTIRRKNIRDILCIKKAAQYRYYDENFNIKKEYVDPLDLILPYSKYDDYRNIPYQAIQKKYQVWELAQMNPHFTENDLYEIAKTQAGQNKNPRWTFGSSYEGYYRDNQSMRPWVDFYVTVVEFYFMTQNVEKRVKKKNKHGGFFFKKKGPDYDLTVKPNDIQIEDLGTVWGVKGEKYTVHKFKVNGENGAKEYFAENKTKRRKERSEVIKKIAKYRYSGKWIPGTEWLWDYGLDKNIEREKVNGSYSPETELPIHIIAPNIYDMQNKSLVERMIPFEDQMNLANLKLQQTLIKAVPPGIQFDIDALDGIILEEGKGADPMQILKMYLQTGSIPFSSTREDGTPINGKAVEQLPNGIGKEFQSYIVAIQHNMQMMNDVIGFNSAVDASSPNAEALVGVQKMALNATNNALRPLYKSFLDLEKSVTKRIMLMIQDSMERNEKAFKMAIGATPVTALKIGKDIALSQFAIDLELAPDEEEKMQVEQLIQIGLTNGTLYTSDVIRIRQLLQSSVKLAAQLLALLEKKNREDKQKESMMLQQQNAEVQMQSNQASEQAKQQTVQLAHQLEKDKLAFEAQLAEQAAQANFERDRELQLLKNEGSQADAIIAARGKIAQQESSNQGKAQIESMKESKPKTDGKA